MKMPTFLLIGAAKAGTTSLYYYLDQHPDIFMSKVKEPKFISAQFLHLPQKGPGDSATARNTVKKWSKYVSLFKNANQNVLGEASVDTLFYGENSVEIIKKYLGDPKIIVILRNPVKRAHSAYSHLVRDNREPLSFEEALMKEDKRRKGNWEFIWSYKKTGLYYEQVKCFMDHFDRVKVVLFDDFKENAVGVAKDVYEFLDVDPNFSPIVEGKHNATGIPKSVLLHALLGRDFIINKWIFRGMKKLVSEKKMEAMRLKAVAKNLNPVSKMKEETRKMLIEYYKEDVGKLGELINKDLSGWLK